MLALKACIAPKVRRRGKAAERASRSAAAAAADVVAPRSPPAARDQASSPVISAPAAPEPAAAQAPRDAGAMATARLSPHCARRAAAASADSGAAARRSRSGSWDDATSPKPERTRSGGQQHEGRPDARRNRTEAEVDSRSQPKSVASAETPPAYTPVSRLEWSSSLSSDSPCVRSGCSNTAPLPVGWRQAERDGASYFYNRRTGKRLWHHPSGCECPADTPLPLKTLSTASSAQQSPAAWTRSWSSEGGNTPHANPGLPNAYYYKRGWHGAAPTLSLSTTSSANRTTSTGTGISGRTGSSATSASLPVSEPSPNAKRGASKTLSVASAAAPYPPPPTPVGRGLLAESARKPGPPGAPRRSIVKMLAQLDRELLERPSSPCGQSPRAQQLRKPPLRDQSGGFAAPTMCPAAEAEVAGPEEGVPPTVSAAAMAPRGRKRQPRSRRGSFAESVLSQPASIPDEPISSGAFSEREDEACTGSGGSRSTRSSDGNGTSGRAEDVRDLGRGWALNQKKRLSTKYESDFEGSGVEIEQPVVRFEVPHAREHEI